MEQTTRLCFFHANLLLQIVLVAAISLASKAAAAPAGPAGIYVIGDTRNVPGEVAKIDLDHVSGYTLRVPWGDIETWNAATQAPHYDFSRMVTALEDLRSRGKKMTLEIFIHKAPAYLLDPPGMTTWTNPHPTQGGIQPLPWDSRALAAYQAMISNLANYPVPGTPWQIKDHPTLESVDAPIVGLQGLRDLSNTLIGHPSYTRAKFIQATIDSASVNRTAFSNKHGFLAIFLMDDNGPGVSMDQAVLDRLRTEFNIPGKPTLGYFQETLSDAGPRTDTLGSLLHAASQETYIMFQALRPWTLKPGDTVPPETASGTPVTGIRHAWRNYRSTYVEIYGGDVLNTNHAVQLKKWDRFFHAQPSDAPPDTCFINSICVLNASSPAHDDAPKCFLPRCAGPPQCRCPGRHHRIRLHRHPPGAQIRIPARHHQPCHAGSQLPREIRGTQPRPPHRLRVRPPAG